MNDTQAKLLREPFDEKQIGKLPRAANKAAKDANKKGNCPVCKKYHVLPAVHLDYAGHAAVTDRFLQVDPEWTWRPMAVGPNGEPILTNGGLWILLTIAGVTRPGFGDAENGKGMKEIIGDALRNAGMRFGVGLDLWSKEDLHAEEEATEPAKSAAPVTGVEILDTPAEVTAAKLAGFQQHEKIDALIARLDEVAPKPGAGNWRTWTETQSVALYKHKLNEVTVIEAEKIAVFLQGELDKAQVAA